MNVYLGGILGFLWVGDVVHWAMHRLDKTLNDETGQESLSRTSARAAIN